MQKRTNFMAVALVVLLVGTSSVFAQVQAGDCTACHNDTTVITGKQFAMEETLHATGHSAAYAGGRGSCTACHSGASFSAMVAEGQNPSEFSTVVDVTRQDCRACQRTPYVAGHSGPSRTAERTPTSRPRQFSAGSGRGHGGRRVGATRYGVREGLRGALGSGARSRRRTAQLPNTPG